MKFLMALLISLTFAGSVFALETVDGAKKDIEAAKIEMKSKLDALDAKIDQLKASTAEKSTAAKEKTLKEVQETRDKLRADYELMKSETDSKWKAFKKRMGRAIDKLNAKAQKALND